MKILSNVILYLDDFLSPVLLIWDRFLPCRAKKSVMLPDYHYVDHRIEILGHDTNYSSVDLHAIAEARYSMLPSAKTK